MKGLNILVHLLLVLTLFGALINFFLCFLARMSEDELDSEDHLESRLLCIWKDLGIENYYKQTENSEKGHLVSQIIKKHVYNACSDLPKAVFGSGHPNTEIKTAFAGTFLELVILLRVEKSAQNHSPSARVLRAFSQLSRVFGSSHPDTETIK